MYRYLIIESTSNLSMYETTLIAFFTDMMMIDHIDKTEKHIILYYQGDVEISFKDIIVNLSSDILSDIRLFESYRFRTESERDKNRDAIIEMLKLIAISKQAYLNEQIVLSLLIRSTNKSYHPCFLKNYANDQLMLHSVKVYLESSQNTSYAAKQLFIHRNTLIQRIDKFIEVTGFNIREFVPGYLIYSLLSVHNQ